MNARSQITRLEAALDAILFAHTAVDTPYGDYSYGKGYTRQGPRGKTFNSGSSYRKNRADDIRARRKNLTARPEQIERAENNRALKGYYKVKEGQWKRGMKEEYDAAFTRRAAAADAANALRSKRIKIGAGVGAAALIGAGLIARRNRREDDTSSPR